MSEIKITALSGGIVMPVSKSEVSVFEPANAHDMHLRRATARVCRAAAATCGIENPLLRHALGLLVYGWCVDKAPPPEADELAHHWIDTMTNQQRADFVRDLLRSSMSVQRSVHGVREVPHALVSEGVSVVTRAAREWVSKHPRPSAVSPSLLIPEPPSGVDASAEETHEPDNRS